MARIKKLTKQERTLNEDVENQKDFFAYDSSVLYASTDIPMIFDAVQLNDLLVPPNKIWEGFDKTGEALDAKKTFSADNVERYLFTAETMEDGRVEVELTVYSPDFPSKKPVLLLGDGNVLPQKEVIDSLVKRGCIVFVPDYNGCGENSSTVFPTSLFYGKKGQEGAHLTSLSPTAKDTCAYHYALIGRRTLAFMKEVYDCKEAVAVGVGYGSEIAMQVAGSERKFVCGVGLLCGAGYPEYADIPKYPYRPLTFGYKKLGFIIGESGVSYLKNYPHPVFTAVGSNGIRSDVDRLSSLKNLISGDLTVSICSQWVENIDENAFNNFLLWLDETFYYSSFPSAPTTTLDVNSDGTVYANVKANPVLPVKKVTLYYSYNDNNHKTRIWKQVPCETVGTGEYIAKMTFSKPCKTLFFYTEAQYLGGMTSTECPKYLEMEKYRIALLPQKSTSVIFRYGADGKASGVLSDAVVFGDPLQEGSAPSGAKGAVCPNGPMRLFVSESTQNAKPMNILQLDTYSEEKFCPLELEITVRSSESKYRALKYVQKDVNFSCTQFSCGDFKDELFRPLTSWEDASVLTILTPNVIVNKIMFI